MTASVPVLYRERSTLIHQRDPRVKLVLFILLFLYLFIAPNWQWLLLMSVLGIIMALIARTPWQWLVIFWSIHIPSFLVIIGIPLAKQIASGNLTFNDELASGLRLVLAWTAAIVVSLSLFSTMNANDLTNGLRGLKMPAVGAFTVGLAYRLLYVTLGEGFQIANAMKLKGVDLETKNPIRLIKNSLKLSFPLLFAVLRRGPTLMSALEMRGFLKGGQVHKFGKLDFGDVLFLLMGIGLFVLALGARMGWLPFSMPFGA